MLPRRVERAGSTGKPASIVRWSLLFLLAVGIVMPQTSLAQVLYGSITGNVTDQQGAVAAGAKVAVKEVNTNIVKTTVTDSRGVYRFSDLVPGTYNVTFEAPSFKTLVQKGIKVDTNAVQRVNAQLEVSPVSEVVEVTYASPALQTDRSDMHITQNARQINDLPLGGGIGRNYQSLMEIVPGATVQRNEAADGAANSTSGSPQRSMSFSTNGVSGGINQTRIDGQPVQYIWLPTNTAYVPSAEAIQEVSIVTNSFNADQGLAGGAAVNVVVKSGTNQVHATAWGYDTNSHFTARQIFAPASQVLPPKNIVAQFGGNLGGPLVRDKLFFFGNVERSTQRVAAGGITQTIAPANLRPGAGGGVRFPTPTEDPVYGAIIYDPLSNPDPARRTPFPDNTIPANRIDQAALWLAGRLPATTAAGYNSNIRTIGAASYNRTNWDTKVTFAASSRLSMFARYANSPHLIDDAYGLGGAGGAASGGGQVGRGIGRTQVLGSGLTYMFSPTLMLDANVGFTQQKVGAEAPDIDTKSGSAADQMNIPGTNGPNRLQGGMPGIYFLSGWSNLGNANTGSPFQFNDKTYTASVNLQKTMGAHLFRMGTEYQNQQMNHWQPQAQGFQTVRGGFQFSGLATMLQNGTTPGDVRFNEWADFLLGMPTNAGKTEQLIIPNSLRMKTYSAYLQDTWQLSKALTLSLGLRYEYMPFVMRPGGKGVNRFDPSDGWVYLGGYGNTPQDTGASGSGRLTPRAGLAYRLNDKTVFRAGFGQSMDPTSYYNFRDAYPTVYGWTMPQVVYSGAPNAYIPVTTFRQGLVNPGAALDLSQGRLRLPANSNVNTYEKDLKRGYINSWNIALQRELASWLTTQVAYVGTRAKQMNSYNVNAGAPGLGDAGRPFNVNGWTSGGTNVNMYARFGDMRYDGLQAELRARSNSGQAGLAYTYSKTTNYVDNQVGNAAGASFPRIAYLQNKELNKGLAGYNRTHVLQLFWVWDLPFGKDKAFAKSGLANVLFGGWQINGILADMTGTPIYIIDGNGGNLNAAGSGQIVDRVGTIKTYPNNKVDAAGLPQGANPAEYRFFDTTAYQLVRIPAGQTQRFGNNERNSQPGPNYWNVDLGLFRNIGLPGRAKLQLRAEALNALNHANFRSPGSAYLGGNDANAAGTFGYLTATTGVASRTIRFGARLSF